MTEPDKTTVAQLSAQVKLLTKVADYERSKAEAAMQLMQTQIKKLCDWSQSAIHKYPILVYEIGKPPVPIRTRK